MSHRSRYFDGDQANSAVTISAANPVGGTHVQHRFSSIEEAAAGPGSAIDVAAASPGAPEFRDRLRDVIETRTAKSTLNRIAKEMESVLAATPRKVDMTLPAPTDAEREIGTIYAGMVDSDGSAQPEIRYLNPGDTLTVGEAAPSATYRVTGGRPAGLGRGLGALIPTAADYVKLAVTESEAKPYMVVECPSCPGRRKWLVRVYRTPEGDAVEAQLPNGPHGALSRTWMWLNKVDLILLDHCGRSYQIDRGWIKRQRRTRVQAPLG